MKKLLENKYLKIIFILVIGFLIGWIIKPSSSEPISSSDHQHIEESGIWTCSMHPQVQKDGPGSCPFCGMDLIPLESDASDGDGSEFTVKLSNAAMKIAEVEMSTIEKKAPYKEVYLPGKVMADERKITELIARFPGRIEKLFINFTGQKVRKGQVLAKIYSPNLVTAQKELFEAIKFKETNPSYYKASRNKLKLWDLTDKQISKIEESGEVTFYFDVLSPVSGTVTMRHVALGDYVKEGSALFEVVDLRHVWVMFDAYESDIPWIKLGDKIKFKIKSIPGREFESTVTFIDPVLDRMSRVAGVRTELDNPKGLLKPQMLATGILETMLPGSSDRLFIPKSAILWTGKKAVVYVVTDDRNNMFQFREIDLGADAGDYYIVEAGLNEGEQVASNGVFKIDAAAQLKGEKSMMNPSGGKQSMAHDHGSMGGEDSKKQETSHPEKKIEADMIMSVNEDFREQLTEVYRAYLSLENALIETDPATSKTAATKVESMLAKVDMSLVKGEMHNHWMASLNGLTEAIRKISDTNDVEKQRLAFADLSDLLYSAVKMFGVKGETIYYQFCPMAKDGEGAYWLSNILEIKNPYYGDAMLTCGENKEVIGN